MGNASIRIEKRPIGYEVVSYRSGDRLGYSIGSYKTKDEAIKFKKNYMRSNQ